MDALIHILRNDATMPHTEIARLLDLSLEQVEGRIAELEKQGVILGYQAIVNREKCNHGAVAAMIEVKLTPEREGGFDRIAQRIARFEEVQSCYLMSGSQDLLIVVEAPNIRHVASFVAEKLSTIEAVQSTVTNFKLKTYKENGTFYQMDATPERLTVAP
ncbi:MAG: AsnC family transcriptional regulator [Verrucomicrobia bacterium]|nr:MAG: AsnC family transcriptional regulator [Verrucomicrobiota bacterium]